MDKCISAFVDLCDKPGKSDEPLSEKQIKHYSKIKLEIEDMK